MSMSQPRKSPRIQNIMQGTRGYVYGSVVNQNIDQSQIIKSNTKYRDYKVFGSENSCLMGAADDLRQMTAFPYILT